MAWCGRLSLAAVLFVACTSSQEPGPILEGGDSTDGGLFFPGVTTESGDGSESPDASPSAPVGSSPSTGVAETPPSPGVTSVGAPAPTGIATTPPAPATTGGAGPPTRDDAACAALERDYAAALVRATECDFFALGPTCQLDAEVTLACPACRVAVQNAGELAALREQWRVLGCVTRGRDCSAFVCTSLARGICVPRGAGGACEGTTAVTPSF